MYQRPIHQKPIAVVANDVQSTMEWIRETYSSLVKDINLTTSRVTLTNGKVYQVITSAEQAKAWEFSDYMVAPHYSHLIDVVKSRIR